jgi:hypothetical protein
VVAKGGDLSGSDGDSGSTSVLSVREMRRLSVLAAGVLGFAVGTALLMQQQ